MKPPMTIQEFARMGGKAYWASMTKAERTVEGRRRAMLRWNKRKKGKKP